MTLLAHLRADVRAFSRLLAALPRPTLTVSAGPIVATWPAPPAAPLCPCPPGEPMASCLRHGAIKVTR